MNIKHYVLDTELRIQEAEFIVAAQWWESEWKRGYKGDHVIGSTIVKPDGSTVDLREVNYVQKEEDVHVSTVFLFLDHDWTGQGPPVLFETMIFGGELDEYQERTTTYELASTQHTKAVEAVLATLKIKS